MSRIKAIAGDKCFAVENKKIPVKQGKVVDVVEEKKGKLPRWVRNFRPEQMSSEINYREVFRCKYVGTGVMCAMLNVGRTVFSHNVSLLPKEKKEDTAITDVDMPVMLPAVEQEPVSEQDGSEITVDVPGVLKRNSELVDKNNVLFRQNESLHRANFRLEVYSSILFVIAALSTLVGLYAH